MRRWGIGCALGILVLLVAGCSLTRRVAIGSMLPILENTAAVARERDDLEMIGAAFPGNLLLLDGLIRTQPGNARLLELGAYLYFGYALGFVELDDPARARAYYALGRDYGTRALLRRSAFRKRAQGSLDDYRQGLAALGARDAAAMAWTAANWARWLGASLDEPAAIAEAPRLEALLDRLLEVAPEFEHGLPHALRGSYDALRPEMLGGNPARARRHFEAAFAIAARRMLLFQAFYAEFYCRQVLDEDGFTAALDEIDAVRVEGLPEARLLNAIARRRAAWLRERRTELF